MVDRKRPALPSGLLKNKWISSIVSLVVGLGLGTTIGREILGAAGVPASCVRTIQRADAAIGAGKAVADDGRAALDAVTALRINEAGNLLVEAKDGAIRLVTEAKRFDRARKTCDDDRR